VYAGPGDTLFQRLRDHLPIRRDPTVHLTSRCSRAACDGDEAQQVIAGAEGKERQFDPVLCSRATVKGIRRDGPRAGVDEGAGGVDDVRVQHDRQCAPFGRLMNAYQRADVVVWRKGSERRR
jgi:hypothetical protein